MKVYSYKKSLIVGTIIGAIQIIFLTIFMAIILYLTDGEWFFYKEGMSKQIGNIHLDDVDKIGYIVAAIIPLILLRYNSVKYLPPLIISSIFSYCITFYVLDGILYYLFTCNILGGLDILHFGGWIFPVGAFIGTMLAVFINMIINFDKKKQKN